MMCVLNQLGNVCEIAVLSFGASAVLNESCCRWAAPLGFIDVPNARSSHRKTVARGGGLSIVLVFMAVLGYLSSRQLLAPKVIFALLGALLIAGLGLCDDRWHLSPRSRLVAQAVASVWAVSWFPGVPLYLGGVRWQGGFVGMLLIAVGLIWMVNLSNFMDGLDGLAATQFSSVFTAGAALLLFDQQYGLALLCASIAAACGGFLIANWHPARIMLGDVGSCFLGYCTGTVMLAHASARSSAVWPWFLLMGVFIADSTVTLLRRMQLGLPVTQAHRSHAYQKLAVTYGHAAVSKGVLAVNILFLWPLAWCAWKSPASGPVLFLAAILPLAYLVYRCGAGLPEIVAPIVFAGMGRGQLEVLDLNGPAASRGRT
jgi:glycosyltransferase WbpL